MHWTTVNGVPAADVVTLTDVTTAAISSGAVVYNYTTKADRPMKILEAYTKQFNGSNVPIEILARERYDNLATKDNDGRINQLWFDPQKGASTINVWPETSEERDYLILRVQRTLNDIDTSTDVPDLPQEWYMPLSYNLAVDLAPKYGIPTEEYRKLIQRAMYYYSLAREFDNEHPASVFFEPSRYV
jgi:hypothetical protein